MKKILAAFLMMALLIAGGATAETDSSEYMPIQISLRGNPTTGYEWSCEYQNNGVLEAPMQEYVPDENQAGLLGAGGTYEYYFGVRSPGKTQIIFNYGISWSLAAPEESIILNVNVDEAGNTTVKWAAMYAGDNTVMVRLPGDPTSGMDWYYEADDSGVAVLATEDYQAYNINLEGAGGETTYLFRVEKPGEAVLLFRHADVWDPYATANETYAVMLNVSEDMEITMTVDEQ